MIDNHNGYSFNLPPQASGHAGVTSVRNSAKRQRGLFINPNATKRQPPPLSYDPNFSDQRRKVGNLQLSQAQTSSVDSRGNQSSTSTNGRGVQIISRKYIHFAGSNMNTSSQPSARSNVLNQNSRHLVSKLPLASLNPTIDASPRDFPSSREQKLSSRGTGGVSQRAKPKQQQHQLGFRRQQIMDITDDANTNSTNQLLTIQTNNERSIENDHQNSSSQPPPVYSYFYHSSGNDTLNRLNSKKTLRNIQKQPSKKELTTSFTKQDSFQFTKKQNLIGESSISSSRDKQPQLFKIKKQSHQNNQPPQIKEQAIPQIGKRRPLIIRKNNFISNNVTSTQNLTSNISNITTTNHDASPNQTNNGTLFTATSGRFNNTNNTNSFAGVTDPSMSQTRHGITQILKSLNSTQQSNDLHTSLKDTKLIKMNFSKKKLDTARKSRLQQLQDTIPSIQQPTLSQQILQQVSNSQQPESRSQHPLSILMKKKRSFMIPKVKIDNAQQESLNSLNPTISNKGSARDQPRIQAQSAAIGKPSFQTIEEKKSMPMQPASLRPIIVSEERPVQQIPSDQVTPNHSKVVTRGQIMRMLKQKAKNSNENSVQRNMDDTLQKKSSKNLLPRVESQKDLVNINPEKKSDKHFVQEELIILENINDSSCTPGELHTMLILNNNSSKEQDISRRDNYIVEKNEEDLDLDAIDVQPETIQLELQVSQKVLPLVSQSLLQLPEPVTVNSSAQKPSEDKVLTPNDITSPTADTNNTQNKKRYFNNSAVEVKSPIGTATSFKSQNSQQAGPNPDEIIQFPMKPGKALKIHLNQLTDYEKGEILDFSDVYFLGLQAQKVQGNPKNEFNYGYDDDKGDYKIVMKDHIGYRYEILSFLGKGSFGTAVKCFDHKKKEEVALKIVKNKKKYQYQAGVELKLLNFLQENDPDDIMNVIHMKDYVIFRKHLCISFELLSMNLFEFLKINDFNGFDHNLIRRFAIQLLYALKYLKEFQIIHCDLKPENILLKEPNKSGIKIIDFGSSAFIDERVYTYIQSRFYRAPEIMLGIPYTCAIDMWSFGCIMAELYIGYPIFPGESENDQMSRILEMLNIPSRSVYEISQRRHKFFVENDGDFEPIMLKNSRGKLRKPGGKPLSLLIGDEDPDFLDFVQKCLEWDPELRLSPDEALRHVWVLKGLPPQVLIHHQRMHNITTPELPDTVKDARDKFFQDMQIDQFGGSKGKQSQQQSSNKHSASKSKQQQQKNETLKSLERAQLKNQLHQLNPNKLQQSSGQKGSSIVIHSKVMPNQAEGKVPYAPGKEAEFKSPKFQTVNTNNTTSNQNSENTKVFKRRAVGRQLITKNTTNQQQLTQEL